jgi:3-deoxy-manno-octulosonate cytidylyltransferase (CMP-KDO synthetase)
VGIIPARLASTRLPEKALQDLGGAPLVVRVLERAKQASALRDVVVATDDERIVRAVRAAGGRALLTRSDHPTGLDRVAEAATQLRDAGELSPRDVVLDVQGDEPFLSPAGIDRLVALFEDPEVRVGTLAAPFAAAEEARDPDRVKVVVDARGRALYFSRSLIPHGLGTGLLPLLHVGLYAFRLDTLLELAELPPCALEQAERLEQLRALWNGIPIYVATGDYHSWGIDTPDDLDRARRVWVERRNTR